MLVDTTQLHNKPADLSQPLLVQLHEDSFQSHLCDTPNLEVQVTRAELLWVYKDIHTMRRMEMAADALYKAKLVHGFCHLAIGPLDRFVKFLIFCCAVIVLTVLDVFIGSCFSWPRARDLQG